MLGAGVLDWNHDGVVLTAEQKLFYEKNGYLVVRNVVPKYELDRYYARFKDICEQKVSRGGMTVMRDISIAKSEFKTGVQAITKIQDFNSDNVLFDYCRYPAICDIVQDLIAKPGNTLMSMHTMLINKPPDNGKLTSRHPMHQDLQYFNFRPADFICCAWTAMEKVWFLKQNKFFQINRANGCLVVVPGSHKGELLPHGYPDWEGGVNKAYHGIQNYDPKMPRLHVEMEAGDTVFFHPLLIHGSGANRTDGFRKAISCHYANDTMCGYVDISSTTQEELSKEILEIAKKRIAKAGMNPEEVQISFADLWRARSREINGLRSNL